MKTIKASVARKQYREFYGESVPSLSVLRCWVKSTLGLRLI